MDRDKIIKALATMLEAECSLYILFVDGTSTDADMSGDEILTDDGYQSDDAKQAVYHMIGDNVVDGACYDDDEYVSVEEIYKQYCD